MIRKKVRDNIVASRNDSLQTVLSKIDDIKEFNIGHFIIGESITFGIKTVIKKFKKIIK